MMSPIAPMVALGVVSYANNWYNTKDATDIKPLVFAGVSALVLEGFGAIPGFESTATLLGWTAFIAFLISPIQKPSPVDNLFKIGKG
jgi:hypothetical protein